MSSIGQQVVKGAGWMVLLRIADRLVGILSLSVLARLLLPEHFGVVALASSLVGFMELMSEFGIELALIRDQQAERRLYDTAWTMRIGRGISLGALLVLLAKPAAAFFSEPRLEAIVYCLAVAGIVQACENIGVVEFRKSLAFDREFRYLLLARCLSVPVAIAMAFAWRSHWALVGGILAQKVIRTALSYRMHSYRPRLSTSGARDLLDFSKWIVVQNIVHGLNVRAPAFVLGRLSGVAVLAHFDVAHEMATLATTELSAPIRKALFPGFAKLASDVTRLRKGYLDSYGLMVLVGLPIPVAMAVMAPILVHVFLGGYWQPAVPVIQVMAAFGVVQALGTNSSVIYLALNKVRITTMLSTLRLTLLVPLLLWGVTRSGAIGAAWALSVTAAVVLLVDVLTVTRVLDVRASELSRAVVRPLLAAGGMFITLWWALSVSLSSEALGWELIRLVATAVLGLAVYAALIVALWAFRGRPDAAERRVLTMVRDGWDAVRTSGAKRLPASLDQPQERATPPPRTGSFSKKPAEPAVIVFGSNEWDEIWQTRQHISSRLAQRGWRVVYSTGQLFAYQRGSQEWKARPWLSEQRARDSVIVARSGRLQVRWPRVPRWDRYVLRRHAEDLMGAAGWSDAAHRIAYLYNPGFWPYLEYLRCNLVVYHVDDAFALMPGWTAEGEAAQALLIARANVLLASSEAMARLLPDGGPLKARLFPNAADARAFMMAEKECCPPDLQAIPHPRIGYTGSINLKVNLALVAQLASRRPEWQWVLVGPVRETAPKGSAGHREYADTLAACRTLRNVHFLGPKSVGEVARYVAHMDVNTMCYRTDPGGWWTALYPLKLHEYLAAGPPVVAANLEAVREFSSVLAIAETIEDWLHAIEAALRTGGVATKAERQAVAMANTWDHRIDQLVQWLQAAAAAKS